MVPFCPYCFGVSLLKPNSRTKGTLIIQGDTGEPRFEGVEIPGLGVAYLNTLFWYLFLKGAIMKYKSMLVSAWLFQSPGVRLHRLGVYDPGASGLPGGFQAGWIWDFLKIRCTFFWSLQ